jgi:hypothetical protein
VISIGASSRISSSNSIFSASWDSIEAQLLRRLETGLAVDDLIVAANKERIAETEETDRGSDLPHMSRIKLTKLPTGGSKLSERNVGKFQARERVVTSAMPRGRQRHPFLGLNWRYPQIDNARRIRLGRHQFAL